MMYIHIVLLMLCFYIYNIFAFTPAENLTVPAEETHIVIENEPQIIPEEAPAVPEEVPTVPEEVATGEVVPPTEAEIGEIATGEIVPPAEVVTGEILTGEMLTGEDLISYEEEYLSGVLEELSGETLYNISGEIVGEVQVTSGEVIPVDLSGVSLLPTPLSVVYPTKNIQLNVSGYITFDSLESVTTTGGEVGANYCSRIAYENLTSILKAGIRTWRETNDYVLQGDAQDLVVQGLADHTLLEVTSGEINTIFSGDNGTGYGFVYDVYISFMNFETKVYHRIVVVYADDGKRYVLDPLRGARTTRPQKLADYLVYYTDETDVHRYIGQGYSPSFIKNGFTFYENITQLFQQSSEEEISTGVVSMEQQFTEEQQLTGQFFSGEQFSGNNETTNEQIVGENRENTQGIQFTGIVEQTGTDEQPQEIITGVQEEIVEGYFDRAYDRGAYNQKIITLQKILTWVTLYSGTMDGIYSDAVIDAVYHYQIKKGILTEQDPIRLRGYLGPSTRKALNDEYIQYQLDTMAQFVVLSGSSCKRVDIECRKQEIQRILSQKGYRLTNKGLVRMSKEALVGSEILDMSKLWGEILMPIVLQSINTFSGQKAEIQIPEGTVIKTDDGKVFTGELLPPAFVQLPTEEILEEHNQKIISIIDVGADEHIEFENNHGSPMYVTLRVPLPGKYVGDTVDIYYSQDGDNWIYMDSQPIQEIDGNPYVIFEANHCTYFGIGSPVGTFFINNNNFSTTTSGVQLTINIPGTTHMRFANTESGLVTALWISYTSGYNRYLTNVPGKQTVYAQFSGTYGIQTLQDSILLDTTTTHPNLRILLDGRLSGNLLINTSPFGAVYNFTSFGGLTAPILSGEQVIALNGTSQYAETGNIGITTYPFAISAWVNPSSLGTTNAIVMLGNSGSTAVYWGIQLTSGKPSVVARNTKAYIGTSPETLMTGKRYHIVGVFNSATQRYIYVNGVRHATNASSVTFSSTNQQVRVGRYVSTTTNYFSGYLDDVRIYTTGLTDQEILAIYQSRAGGIDRPIQYLNAGEFTINEDDSKTYSRDVTLFSSFPDTTKIEYMRFGNSTGEIESNPWILYEKKYSRSLGGILLPLSEGVKTVYAQFKDEKGQIREAQDSIYYEKITDTSLKCLLEGTVNTNNVLPDVTTNSYHFTGYGGLSQVKYDGEKVLSLNGSSQYAQRESIGITAYPFTFSAWVNPKTDVGTDAIVVLGNGNTTNTYYAIQLVNGAPSIVASNTTARVNTVQKIMTGQWYHIVGVFASGKSRTLYINGVPMVTATTSVTFSSTNQQVRIGRYLSTATNYFDGYLDDIRIYNRALSSGEVLALYQQREVITQPPVARNVLYYPSTVTSGNVVAILTGFSEPITILNNSGVASYEFTDNGEFTFWYKDIYENVGSTIASVDWIDRQEPYFFGVQSGMVYSGVLSGGVYQGNITITFYDTYLSGATLNGIPYTSGTLITGEGTYTFVVEDLVGHRTGATFSIVFSQEQKLHNQLIASGYNISGVSLVPLDEEYYIGSTNIDMASYTGELLLPVVLKSATSLSGSFAEVEIPRGAVLKNNNGTPFMGTVHIPTFQPASNYESLIGRPVISAISVGSTNHIYFKDTGDNDIEVIFRMPVPGRSEGELIDVFISEDGNSFTHHISTPVRIIQGQPYVVFTSSHFSVVVTTPNNGINISADKAANSTSGAEYTTLNNMVITEGVNTDFGVSQSNVTLILTAPTNWRFRAGSGSVSYIANRDITSASIAVTDTTVTITYSTNGAPNRIDALTISNLQVQAITGNIVPSSGNIVRSCSNPGTAPMVGITCNVTNFGSLSQTYGAHKYLVITLPGQNFIAGSGNSGTVLNQYINTPFIIPSITATDQFYNIVTSYTGDKTLIYTGPGGTPGYTTGVIFVGGQSTTTLTTTLTEVKTGVMISVSDGTISGPRSSPFDVYQILAGITYSSQIFYEHSGLNNGSIVNSIIATLSTGTFSSTLISSGLVQIENIPQGLTGYYLLSGSNQLRISLTGNAINHYASDSTGIIIRFLSGAFVDMYPEEVSGSTANMFIELYDPVGYFSGQQLRLPGTLSGGQFYDYSPLHRPTTNYGAVSTLRNSSEPIMSFDGNNRYIDVGTYTLTNYTVTARFYTNTLDNTRRSIIGDTAGNRELSINDTNYLEVYNNGQLASTMQIAPNTWYHVAVVKDTYGTKLYINGVLNNQNTSTTTMTNVNLLVGDHTYYNQPRNGYIDEVRIYDSALTPGQIETLYIQKPSYTPRHTHIATPDIRGSVPDPQMNISLTISGITYSAINNQDGTWEALHIGPFASGTYDVQLNYTNVYGRTGMIYYTGGLTVYPDIFIIYQPATTTSGNVIATVTGYDEDVFIVNNSGSPVYIFTGNGSFTFELENTSGDTATITAMVDWIQKASISYNTGIFYEDTGLNNGSITNTIIATLEGDTFTPTLLSSGLVQIENVPAGLTGRYIVSGNTQLIIGLTGNAFNHTTANTTSGVVIRFLEGAFTTYPLNQVGGAITSGFIIQFYDGNIISGQQLWLKGEKSGTQFVDSSPNNRVTIGYNGMSNTLRSGETVIGPFNGTNQYIDVGTYTLADYTMSARFYSNTVAGGYRSILARNNAGTDFEISLYNDRINLYSNNNLTSLSTIVPNTWYHVVVVKDMTGTRLYINGVLDNANTYTGGLTATALAVGRWNTSQHWTGMIDEVQIFDSPLTEQQIQELYLKKPSYTGETVYTSMPTLTGNVSDPLMWIWVTVSGVTYTGINNQDGTRSVNAIGPLSSGIYDVKIDYMNVYGATGMAYYTGGLVITLFSTGTLTISGPVSFDFGSRDASQWVINVEKTFSGVDDYFQVIDMQGQDTGYYTTITISDMSNSNGDIIPNTLIAIKALTGIVTLSGTENPRVYSAITGSYQYFDASPRTFISRDTAANYGVTGIYGLHTVWKIDVPILQDPGIYTGVITYTLY